MDAIQLTPQRYDQLRTFFFLTCDLEQEAQQTLLDQLAPDHDLRAAVERLLGRRSEAER